MRSLRQLHLYLGCLFAPLLFYFSCSGAWQVFRLNDLPKADSGEPPSALRSLLHAVSNPHTHSTLPGLSPKTAHSALFDWFAVLLAVGLCVTTVIGILIALRSTRKKGRVVACLVAGVLVPALFLWLGA